MIKKKLIIGMTGLSLGLSGCGSILYTDTLAPVYSISSSKTSQKKSPVTQSTAANSVAIEQSGGSPVVSNSQNNPYVTGNNSVPPTVVRPNVNAQPATAAINNSAAANDPRIKEASEVLTNTTQSGQSTVAAARPSSASQMPVPTAQQAATQTVQSTTIEAARPVNQAATTAATAATAAVTPPKPATAQSATKSLLQEARNSVAAGNYEKAASALERAHRIEPSNAKILYDIAQIRYAQGKYRQAESFASKAANYTKSAGLSKKIWTILGNSRKALGNSTGAAAAAQKAASF